MDAESVVKLLAEHATQYAATTVSTLIRPVSRFEPVTTPADGPNQLVADNAMVVRPWLNSKLITYAVLSIVLGLSINALIPDRKPAPELFSSVVVVLVSWFFSGSILHALCRVFRGKGQYVDSMSVVLQVFGAVYVATSFLGLAAAILSRNTIVAGAIEKIPVAGEAMIGHPAFLFFPIGAALLMIYLPLSLRSVHRLGWVPTVLVGLLPWVSVWLAAEVYKWIGIMIQGYLGM